MALSGFIRFDIEGAHHEVEDREEFRGFDRIKPEKQKSVQKKENTIRPQPPVQSHIETCCCQKMVKIWKVQLVRKPVWWCSPTDESESCHSSGVVPVSVFSVSAESLIITNGETLELGGSKSYDNVLISNGTIYLTNNTVITSASDIQILSGGTVTWHYTTTNWSTNIYLNSSGRGGSGTSILAKNGSNAWNITLQAASNLTIIGKIDLRGGAGQTHIGNAAQGFFGGDFRPPASRIDHTGGTGGSSYGGNGGQLILRTKILYTNGWTYFTDGGANGLAGGGGKGGVPGTGSWGSSSVKEFQIFGSGGPWDGSSGANGTGYNGLSGTNGVMDVIKQAKVRPSFENGQLTLNLDMTSTSATYSVECCTNLPEADWQPIGTFSGANGATNWISPSSNHLDKAFYRIQTVY